MKNIMDLNGIVRALNEQDQLHDWTVEFIEYIDGKVAAVTMRSYEENVLYRLRFRDVLHCEMRVDMLLRTIGEVQVSRGENVAVSISGVGIEMQAKDLALEIQKCA